MAFIGVAIVAVLALMAVLFAFAMLEMLLRILAEAFVRVVLALAASITAGFLAGILASLSGQDGISIGGIVAMGLFLPALVAVWKMRGSVSDRIDGAPARPRSPRRALPPVSPPVVEVVETKLGVTDAKELIAAWDRAEALSPGAGLGRARLACARMLAAYEASTSREPADIDMALFIRRHVPGLLEDTCALLDIATPEERRAAIATMTVELIQLGEDAERSLAPHKAGIRDRLAVRHLRFAGRRSEGRAWQ